MEEPLVSVVIPIYNVEEYLDRCVESVVNQTYTGLEIILVDDGSSDNCPSMCDAWAERDARIKVFHKKNAGLGMARNTGIDNASGKYILFFDSDDHVHLELVEKCVQSALENDSDIVAFGLHDVYADGRQTPKRIHADKTLFKDKEIVNDLLPGMFTYKMGIGISSCGKMYNLDTLKKHGNRFMSEREIVSEDAYFAIGYYGRLHTVSIVNEDLYYYWKRSDSLSHSYRADRHEKNGIFLKRALELACKEGLPNAVCVHLKARYHMYTVSSLKQLSASELSDKEKKTQTDKILKDKILHSTLDANVIKTHKKTLKIFFTFLKFKCYPICKLMLNIKMKNPT